MLQVKTLTFNPFQENTYLLYDETKECAIVDAGMFTSAEEQQLVAIINNLGLKPVLMLQTHMHVDHVFGGNFVNRTYGLLPQGHVADEFFIGQTKDYAKQFGIEMAENPPAISKFLEEGDKVVFGNTWLEVIHVPGHSPGGILFYHQETANLIAGDVLFSGSVGRSDLPGGDHDSLISGILQKLMVLPDDVVVYPGHGPSTTIGNERSHNPFLQ
jgi:hydroxyacylglutathione hydrolase